MHRRGLLQICRNLREHSLLGVGGFERQNAFQRIAHARLTDAKGNSGPLLRFFSSQRKTQLIKEQLFEYQAAMCGRAKFVEELNRYLRRRKMKEAKRVAASRKFVACEDSRRQSLRRNRREILQRAINDTSQNTRTDVADRFINGHDPAHFGGIR